MICGSTRVMRGTMHLMQTLRKPAPSRRRAAVVIAVGGSVFAGAATLSAHDFWIVPNAFAIDTNGSMEVRGQTSVKFPTSVSAVTPERIAEARLIAASSEERIGDL